MSVAEGASRRRCPPLARERSAARRRGPLRPLLALWLLGAAACTRAGYGLPRPAETGPGDGPAAARGDRGAADRGLLGDGSPGDGGAALVPRAPFGAGRWQLGPATPLAVLNGPGWDAEACLLADGLTLYFSSERAGGAGGKDVYVARRTQPGGAFGAPQNVAALNAADDDALNLSSDGLSAYLSTDRPGGVGFEDIWYAARTDPTAPWTIEQFTPLAQLNTALADWDPLPAADDLELFYAPQQPEGPLGQHIWVARRTDRDRPWSAGGPLPELHLADAKSADPTLSPDLRVIVFTRADDLWYAVRPRRDAPFAAPQPLPGINTTDGESEACISGDGSELFFSTDRPGGLGGEDIWVAAIAEGP